MEKLRISLAVLFESLCSALLTGAVTAACLRKFILAGAMLAAAAVFIAAALIYRKKHPFRALSEEQKADAAFMKKYGYEKSGVKTISVILYILSAAAGVMLAALVFARYTVILLAAPVFITALTLLILNYAVFGKVDASAPPKIPEKETDSKDTDNNIGNKKNY